MFKYTPAKTLLHWYRKNHRTWVSSRSDSIFQQEMALCGNDFQAWSVFRRCWEHSCFYSCTRLQKVPVNGWLFPVSMFDETEV